MRFCKIIKNVTEDKGADDQAKTIEDSESALQFALLIRGNLCAGKTLKRRAGDAAQTVWDHYKIHHPAFSNYRYQDEPYRVTYKAGDNIFLRAEFGYRVPEQTSLYGYQEQPDGNAQRTNASRGPVEFLIEKKRQQVFNGFLGDVH